MQIQLNKNLKITGEHIRQNDVTGSIIKDEFVVTDKANANKDAKEKLKLLKLQNKSSSGSY